MFCLATIGVSRPSCFGRKESIGAAVKEKSMGVPYATYNGLQSGVLVL